MSEQYERNTRVRASQIKGILPSDIKYTGSAPVDGKVIAYDSATEKFAWVSNTGEGSDPIPRWRLWFGA